MLISPIQGFTRFSDRRLSFATAKFHAAATLSSTSYAHYLGLSWKKILQIHLLGTNAIFPYPASLLWTSPSRHCRTATWEIFEGHWHFAVFRLKNKISHIFTANWNSSRQAEYISSYFNEAYFILVFKLLLKSYDFFFLSFF